jgi:hypothetical protein
MFHRRTRSSCGEVMGCNEEESCRVRTQAFLEVSSLFFNIINIALLIKYNFNLYNYNIVLFEFNLYEFKKCDLRVFLV